MTANDDDRLEAEAFLTAYHHGLPRLALIDTCADLVTKTRLKERDRCANVCENMGRTHTVRQTADKMREGK